MASSASLSSAPWFSFPDGVVPVVCDLLGEVGGASGIEPAKFVWLPGPDEPRWRHAELEALPCPNPERDHALPRG